MVSLPTSLPRSRAERQGLAAGNRRVGGLIAVMRVSSLVQPAARSWSAFGRPPLSPFGPNQDTTTRSGRPTLKISSESHRPLRTSFAAGIAANWVGTVTATSVPVGPPNKRLKLAGAHK